MDDLTNHQLVLLCMLVSFVSSIATGILTVAILEEAPLTVTQTVTRVVERTIDKVTPESLKPMLGEVVPQTPTQNTTVVIPAKEEDLLLSAIRKNTGRVVEIYVETPGDASSSTPLANGFVVSRDGLVVTERMVLKDKQGELPSEYRIVFGDGRSFSATLENREVGDSLVFLRPVSTGTSVNFPSVAFPDISPQIGQSLIILGPKLEDGIERTMISKIVSEVLLPGASTTISTIVALETSPRISFELIGSLVVNLDGQAIGIVARDSVGKIQVVSARHILNRVGAARDTKARPAGVNIRENTASLGDAVRDLP